MSVASGHSPPTSSDSKDNPETSTATQQYGTQTIKMRLHTKTDALKQWICHGVDVVSEVAVHVSRFSNLYVIHCLANRLPLPKLDKQCFDKMMYLVTGTQENHFADTQMKRAFDTLYNVPEIMGSHQLLSQRTTDDYRFLDRLTYDMCTNTRVYLRTQFLTRFRQWCTDFVAELVFIDKDQRKSDEKAEKLKQRWKIVNYLFQQTVCSNSDDFIVASIMAHASRVLSAKCNLIWSDEVAKELAIAIAETRLSLAPVTIPKKNKDKTTSLHTIPIRPVTHAKLLNKSINWAYMPWLYKRLLQIETHNTDPNKKQKKTFSLMPIRGLDRCYVSVSNTALREWIYRYRKDENAVGIEIFEKTQHMERKEFFKSFDSESLWYWKQCFDLKKVLRSHNQINFEGPIATDGVGCSITISKPQNVQKAKDEEENKVITLQDDNRGADTSIRLFSSAELDASDVVGVDPGRKTLFTSAIEKRDAAGSKQKHHITTYSADKWRHMSGGNDAKYKREKWAANVSQAYKDWLLGMPSTKVATVAGMQTHVKHLMSKFAQCFKVNGAPKIRRLRMTNYIKQQQSLAKMVNEFISQPKAIGSDKKKLIVAFGDAAFKTAGPTNKMKKELKRRPDVTVVDLDEFHTSLMTNCCAFHSTSPCAVERVGPKHKVLQKDGSVKSESLYSVTFCKRCSCIWNRDVNASVNMLCVFHHAQKNGGARHPFFSRSEPTSKRQRNTANKRKANAAENGSAPPAKKIPAAVRKVSARKRAASNESDDGDSSKKRTKLLQLTTSVVQSEHSANMSSTVAPNTESSGEIGTSQF